MPPSGRNRRIRFRLGREEAQTMAEYAVALAVITPILVLTFTLLGDDVTSAINTVRDLLPGS